MRKVFNAKTKNMIKHYIGTPKDINNFIKVGDTIIYPKYEINKKIKKKLLKDLPFELHKKDSEQGKNIINSANSSIKANSTNQIKYPSGIIKSITKNEKNEIINENIDCSNIKEECINNLKNNSNAELEILINNSFLLYNRKPIIKNIVKKILSPKALEEKILIWKHYIKNLSKEEKAHLIRKFLFYVDKFTKSCYDEFMQVNEIKNAHELFISKKLIEKDINKGISKDNKEDLKIINEILTEYHEMNKIIGCDFDGVPNNESKNSDSEESAKSILFDTCVLNIKEELNGTGYGFTFLRELRDIGNMYTNASVIFDSVFHDCNSIYDLNIFSFINKINKIESYRILWNFFSNYFIENIFVIKFMTQLKNIFGAYEHYDMVQFMNKLVLVKYNTFEYLNRIKKQIEDIIGPEEELDDKMEKIGNIDDILKYIEEDSDKNNEKKPKKHKKKKKKNKNLINDINNIEINNGNDSNDDLEDFDDGLSIIDEDDYALNCFKNDIMAETEFNIGQKIVPILSSDFLEKFS